MPRPASIIVASSILPRYDLRVKLPKLHLIATSDFLACELQHKQKSQSHLTALATFTAVSSGLYGCTVFWEICVKDFENLVGVWGGYDYSGRKLLNFCDRQPVAKRLKIEEFSRLAGVSGINSSTSYSEKFVVIATAFPGFLRFGNHGVRI